MPDYKQMYYVLFNTITRIINLLINAQTKAEEIFLADDTHDTSSNSQQKEEDTPV